MSESRSLQGGGCLGGMWMESEKKSAKGLGTNQLLGALASSMRPLVFPGVQMLPLRHVPPLIQTL